MYQRGWDDGRDGKDMDPMHSRTQTYFQGWLDGRNKRIMAMHAKKDHEPVEVSPRLCPHCRQIIPETKQV